MKALFLAVRPQSVPFGRKAGWWLRLRSGRILSPVRLPVPPLQQVIEMQRLETFYHDARRPRIRPIIGTFTRPTSGSRRRHLTLRKSARDWLRFKKFRCLT